MIGRQLIICKTKHRMRVTTPTKLVAGDATRLDEDTHFRIPGPTTERTDVQL